MQITTTSNYFFIPVRYVQIASCILPRASIQMIYFRILLLFYCFLNGIMLNGWREIGKYWDACVYVVTHMLNGHILVNACDILKFPWSSHLFPSTHFILLRRFILFIHSFSDDTFRDIVFYVFVFSTLNCFAGDIANKLLTNGLSGGGNFGWGFAISLISSID